MAIKEFLQILFNLTIWVFVPFIFVVVLYITALLILRADDRKTRSGMKSGFWAGVMLFLIALVYQISIFLNEGFPRNTLYQGFSIIWTLGASLIGFLILTGGKRMLSTKASGLIVLLSVFGSLYVLLHYLFIRNYNDIILSITLGATFGVLAHFTVSPGSLKKTLHSQDGH